MEMTTQLDWQTQAVAVVAQMGVQLVVLES
jgi:hypothetical protein